MGFNSKCWILQVERQKGRLTDGFSFFHKKNFFNQNKEKIEERDGRKLKGKHSYTRVKTCATDSPGKPQ
jgi:hypothetical protein